MMSLSALLVAPLFLGCAEAWGTDGHTIVAHIADYYLSPEVQAVLRNDLYNVSLNNASEWCDDFDHHPEGSWSEPLHFIDYPGHACAFDWATDCKNDWCNTGAIVNYSKQIFNPNIAKSDRFVALKFLIHMVGDIHQPLHVSSKDDLGGNAIALPFPHFSTLEANWSNPKTNLHSVWDDKIVVQAIYDIEDNNTLKASFVPIYHDWQLIADMLEKRLGGEWATNKSAWQATVAGSRNEATLRAGLSVVAQETATRGCMYAYNYANGSAVRDGDILDRDYYLRGRPIVEEQLAKGGVRLAQLLHEALAQSRAHFSEIMV